jgi:hypothetical protein
MVKVVPNSGEAAWKAQDDLERTGARRRSALADAAGYHKRFTPLGMWSWDAALHTMMDDACKYCSCVRVAAIDGG